MQTIVLSGLRATVLMKEGVALDEKSVAEMLAKQGLTYESASEVKEDPPEVVYVVTVRGVG
ncbi:MAG: hypothetical protein ACSHX6_04230 [Akkermansiaceae bacterium]